VRPPQLGSSTKKKKTHRPEEAAWCGLWRTALDNLPNGTNQLDRYEGLGKGHWLFVYVSDGIRHILEIKMYFFLQRVINNNNGYTLLNPKGAD